MPMQTCDQCENEVGHVFKRGDRKLCRTCFGNTVQASEFKMVSVDAGSLLDALEAATALAGGLRKLAHLTSLDKGKRLDASNRADRIDIAVAKLQEQMYK